MQKSFIVLNLKITSRVYSTNFVNKIKWLGNKKKKKKCLPEMLFTTKAISVKNYIALIINGIF